MAKNKSYRVPEFLFNEKEVQKLLLARKGQTNTPAHKRTLQGVAEQVGMSRKTLHSRLRKVRHAANGDPDCRCVDAERKLCVVFLGLWDKHAPSITAVRTKPMRTPSEAASAVDKLTQFGRTLG